jgi:hypothetical protein
VIGFDQSDFSVRGQQINVNGTLGEVTTSVHQVAQTAIQDFEVIQTYPNPFNNSTTLRYYLKDLGLVRISLYNILGELVHSTIKENQIPGDHLVTLNAVNQPSGTYFLLVETEKQKQVRAILLIK